jgi:cytochrome c peroxidase
MRFDEWTLGGIVAALLAAPTLVVAVDFVDDGVANPDKVLLGQLLFHDKLLSGNLNISCATCHHALADTGDGLSLPVGEGGRGLGVTRDTGTGRDAVHERVPRNAPPVFMLGSTEVTRMFHDGRLEQNPDFPSGFESPAGHDLPDNLENIVAAQAMFPVTSGAEMAGQVRENRIANAAAAGDLPEVWRLLAQRLRDNAEYVALFQAAFPDEIQGRNDITFAHAANAIGAFEIAAWRANASPYDAFLAGDSNALTNNERAGYRLFNGNAGCASCHSGEILSDMAFHAIAMPQVGPGKGQGPSGLEDWGRGAVTGDPGENFKFRTPPLRNVALTAPYGHAGAYDTLEAVVRHHLDPVAALYAYDCAEQIVVPMRDDLDVIDCAVMSDLNLVAGIAAANELTPVSLTDAEVGELVAFLHALTDKSTLDLRRGVPKSVPSGLTIIE